MPSLNNEKRLWAQGLLRVVGVDEVGMAALAGPVVAAACMVTPDTKLIRKVNDSKVLTRLQREGRRILDPAFAPGRHTEIVRGDAKSFSIAAASIVAKVTRDRLMAKLATKYPGYGWEHNCGYPTIDHRKALRELGITPFHRQDFGTVRMMLSTENQIALELEPAGVSPS